MVERNSTAVPRRTDPAPNEWESEAAENSKTTAVIDVRSGAPVIDLTGAGNGSNQNGSHQPSGNGSTIVVERDRSSTPPAPDGVEARAEALAPILARFESGRHPKPGDLRRVLDLVAVAMLAPVAAVLVAVAAVALKLENPSAPVFYRQARTGFKGRRFRIVKLRSMVPDADARKAELAAQNLRNGPDFKVVDDPRITAVGRQLRRTSIDELPQLWNVLRGDMTLVGPRPTSLDVDAYEPWQMERFDVMPGLTGLWQVAARDSESWDDRIALDIAYVRRVRPALDLWILVKTVQIVVLGVGST